MRKETIESVNELCFYALELANESKYSSDYQEVGDLVQTVKNNMFREQVGSVTLQVPINFYEHVKERFLPDNLKFGWLKPRCAYIEAVKFHVA